MSRASVSAALERLVIARAQSLCEYCRLPESFSPDPFVIEHIVPRSQGGDSDAGNLALSCQGCNNFKYTKTMGIDPNSGEPASLHHPRRERWSDHFAWSDDFRLMIGLTATGRATIRTLRLNRSGVVNLRGLLYQAGEHPPVETSTVR